MRPLDSVRGALCFRWLHVAVLWSEDQVRLKDLQGGLNSYEEVMFQTAREAYEKPLLVIWDDL